MKKKKLLLVSALAISAIVISTITVLNIPDLIVNSTPTSYSMTLDKNNKVKNYAQEYDPELEETAATGTVKTDMGSAIDLRMSIGEPRYEQEDCFVNYTEPGGGYVGYFELASPCHGLYKMDYEADCDLTVSVGYSKGNYVDSSTITISGGMSSGSFDLDVLVSTYHMPAHYIKIACNADDTSHIIKSIKLYFTCTESGDPTDPVGNFTYEFNGETPNSITITDFNMNGYAIPDDKTLIIPNYLDGHLVSRINEGVFDNVPWVEHVYVPFCGATKWLDHDVLSVNFAVIFGRNSIHIQYQPIQQYEPWDGYNIYYIPKALKHITVTGYTTSTPTYEGIICIPDYAFYGCNQMITTIDFTCDFNEVGEATFGNCSALKELILPESCSKAGKGAFAGCSNLYIRAKNFDFSLDDKSNPDHRGYTNGYYKSVTVDGVYYDVTKNSYGNLGAIITGCENSLETLYIVDSIQVDDRGAVVQKIANRAFEGHSKLRAVVFVVIKDDMMGHYSFKDCYHATFLLYDPYDQNWPSDWNSGAGRVYYNFKTHEDEREIDGYHYYIMKDSFLEDDPLKEGCLFTGVDIEIGSIYDFASTLAKAKELDPECEHEYTAYFMTYGFENNQYVNEVRLPNKLVLPNYTFYNCSNLTDVYYDGTEEEWNQHVKKGDIGFNVFVGTQVTTIHFNNN